ncbi:MAG: hypothetical protein K2X86_06785 [Cytophagaceae bacterium]|nr:hypothetical protein [Cytophagaceae bacterium]
MILQDKIQTTLSDRKYTKGKPMDKYGEAHWYLHNHKFFNQLTPEELKELSVLIGFLKVKKKSDSEFAQG